MITIVQNRWKGALQGKRGRFFNPKGMYSRAGRNSAPKLRDMSYL